VTFPRAGSYILFGEAQRATGEDVVNRRELTVGAADGPAGQAAQLAEDTAAKSAGPIQVALSGADGLRARQEATLTFRLENRATGRPIQNLQPYLGAPAHIVVLSEDATRFAHTHGELPAAAEADSHGTGGHGASGHSTSTEGFGPEITMHHTFPAAGLYQLWAQFRNGDGDVITVDYVVRVAQ
jgi:Cu+-exporting ATPase